VSAHNYVIERVRIRETNCINIVNTFNTLFRVDDLHLASLDPCNIYARRDARVPLLYNFFNGRRINDERGGFRTQGVYPAGCLDSAEADSDSRETAK